MPQVLVINPGSTTTKLAVFRNNEKIALENVTHSATILNDIHTLVSQIDFRLKILTGFLEKNDVDAKELDAVAAIGGLLKPIEGGVYQINDAMVHDLSSGKYGKHASNLGGLMAYELAKNYDIPAFIADPSVTDELTQVARFSGKKEIERRSTFHALNQKAVARRILKQKGKVYEQSNVIVAHMGGGITVGAHHLGKVIDVTNGLDGEGAFTPGRSGSLPLLPFAHYIQSHQLTENEVMEEIVGKAGFVSYLGTSDAQEIEKRITAGDEEAKLCYDAMIYQIAKEIGSQAVVLKGQVEVIILTGGLAHSDYLVEHIKPLISFLGDIEVYPGEIEMEALNDYAQAALKDSGIIRLYE